MLKYVELKAKPKEFLAISSRKKVRGQELTEVDKLLNKLISGVRIVVENVISGSLEMSNR